ncbi:MAG: hypothetical protein ACOYBY_01085 [Dermatophilaceae bacterium]
MPGVCLGVVVAVSTGVYLGLARSLWFESDDWAFLLRHGTVSQDVPGADLGLWEPHNEHWSTSPILIFRALFAVFGLRQFLPYLGPVLVAHAGVVVLVYLLLVRFGVRRWIAFGASTMLAFNGAGAQNTLWAFQIGFVGPVALGLLALWLFDRHDVGTWPVWPAWAALTLGLTFSSMGLVMLAFVTAYALSRRGIRTALLVGAVPAAVYVVWFVLVGKRGLSSTPHLGLRETMLNVPTYVWTVLTHAWEAMSGIPGGGPVLVLALVAAVAAPGPDRARWLGWAGVVAAFLLAMMIGVARAGFGVEYSKESRYVYVVVALMMPMLAVALNAAADLAAHPRWQMAVLAVLLLGLVVLNGAHLATSIRDERQAAFAALRDRVLASAALVRQGAPILNIYPEQQENPDITTDLLGAKEVQERLPDEQPAPQALLNAAAILQVRVSTTALPVPAAAAVQPLDGFSGPAGSAAGCQTYAATSSQPTIRVDVGQGGGMVRLTSDSTALGTQLRQGGLVSEPVTWAIAAGVPQYVGTSASTVSLLVTLNHPGPVAVCR